MWKLSWATSQSVGFGKIYHLPVLLHHLMDPIYTESEIMVRPYPPQDHEPTEICVEVRNPSSEVGDWLWILIGRISESDYPGMYSIQSTH